MIMNCYIYFFKKLEIIHREMILRNAYDVGLITEYQYKDYISRTMELRNEVDNGPEE